MQVVVVSICTLLGMADPAQDQPSSVVIVTMYEVVGRYQNDPADRQRTFGTFDTRERAEAVSESLKRDHAAGGLLESSTDKPVDLRIVEVKVKQFPDRARKPGQEPTLELRKPAGPPSAPKPKIVVRVYKLENGRWVEQPGRRYETTNDVAKARSYLESVKRTKGWTATWQGPKNPDDSVKVKMPEFVDFKPAYNDPTTENGGSQEAKQAKEKDSSTQPPPGIWEGSGLRLVIGPDKRVKEYGMIGGIYWDDRGRYATSALESTIRGTAITLKLNATGYTAGSSHTFTGRWDGKDVILGKTTMHGDGYTRPITLKRRDAQ